MSDIPYLLIMTVLPLCGAVMVLLAQDDEKTNGRYVISVSMLTVWGSLVFILLALSHVDSSYGHMQLLEKYVWLENPEITLTLGVDAFSLLLILAVNMAALIGMWGGRHEKGCQKSCMVFTLLFLSLITGLFVAADIMAFFIFFAALLFPLFMLIGVFGEVKRRAALFRFTFYSFCGVLLFFWVLVILYNHDGANLLISKISQLTLSSKTEFMVWLGIFAALLSRIPIWPFHGWIAAVYVGIKNPLIFILANMMPLTGIYGLMRFVPESVPVSMVFLATGLEIIAVITMLFIALIALINVDFKFKIFSFMMVYYIFYLMAAFFPTSQFMMNVGYSLFAFMIIFAALEVLVSYQEDECEAQKLLPEGILRLMPRLSVVFTFMIMAGIGMPLSAMFVNNFVLISALLTYNFWTGVCAVSSLAVVCVALLLEIRRRKHEVKFSVEQVSAVRDLSKKDVCFMATMMLVLILSLINPLWFIRG